MKIQWKWYKNTNKGAVWIFWCFLKVLSLFLVVRPKDSCVLPNCICVHSIIILNRTRIVQSFCNEIGGCLICVRKDFVELLACSVLQETIQFHKESCVQLPRLGLLNCCVLCSCIVCVLARFVHKAVLCCRFREWSSPSVWRNASLLVQHLSRYMHLSSKYLVGVVYTQLFALAIH